MRTVDVAAYTVIKEGVEICVRNHAGSKVAKSAKAQAKKGDTEASAPIDALLPAMERNESAVYWLQPKGGTVEQQEACICVDSVFYMLNSKFEKAIFRNVRLTRDFENYERLVDGTRKLVIPRRLFNEKMRTSRRVCPKCLLYQYYHINIITSILSHQYYHINIRTSHPALSLISVCFPLRIESRISQNMTLMRKQQPPARHEAQSDAAAVAPDALAQDSRADAPARPTKRARAAAPLQERKRRKAAADDAFRVVEAALALPCPPLLPTPQSLFSMLCDVFDLEFPGRLPQRAVDEALLALNATT
jgi:hypothetical protein